MGLGDADWMASVWMEDGSPILAYRFRYHADDKNFDSKDEKHWYELTSEEENSPDSIVETVRYLAKNMADIAGTEVYEFMMADFDSLDDFMEEFRKAPFIEMKTERLH